jgi:hypothetical protein
LAFDASSNRAYRGNAHMVVITRSSVRIRLPAPSTLVDGTVRMKSPIGERRLDYWTVMGKTESSVERRGLGEEAVIGDGE